MTQTKEYARAYYRAHINHIEEARKIYRASHKAEASAWHKNYYRQLRLDAIAHYGGKCMCCGETEEAFLSIDHINGGGNEHRKKVHRHIGLWLKKNNYPDGFQILCHNCNQAKGYYGICPHQKSKSGEPPSS
jgi:hypothetical protein